MKGWLTIASWDELGLELVRPIDLETVKATGMMDLTDIRSVQIGDQVWLFLRWTRPRPFPEISARDGTRERWITHGLLPVVLMFEPITQTMQILVMDSERVPFPVGKEVRDVIVWVLFDLFGLESHEIYAGLYTIEPRIPDSREFPSGFDKAFVARTSGPPKSATRAFLSRQMREVGNLVGHVRTSEGISTKDMGVLKFSINMDATPFFFYAVRKRPSHGPTPWTIEVYRPARVAQKYHEPQSPTREEENQAILLARTAEGPIAAMAQAELVIPLSQYDAWVDAHSLEPSSSLPDLDLLTALAVPIWSWPALMPQEQFEAYVQARETG